MRIILVLGFVCLYGSIQAQSSKLDPKKPEQKYLVPGDTIPPFCTTNVLNLDSKELRLSDYKGQLVVLDFWGTWCLLCIREMPYLEQLQEKYKGKLKIIQVTHENLASLNHYLQKRKKALHKDTHLTGVYDGASLQNLFNYSHLPTLVWINKHGILQGVTDADALTAVNIEKAFNNPEYHPANQKKEGDTIKKKIIDIRKSFLGLKTPGDSSHLLMFSSFSKNVEEIYPGTGFAVDSNGMGYSYVMNVPIEGLYKQAYNLNYFGLAYGVDLRWTYDYYNNRTIMEITDTVHFPSWEKINHLPDSIKKQFIYTYLAIQPNSTYQSLYEKFQQDLKLYFGFNARIEKRRLTCMVLTAQDSNLIRSKGGPPHMEFDGAYNASLHNVPLTWLCSEYDRMIYYNPPMINETGFKGNVDLEIFAELRDIKAFRKALKKYKMEVKLEPREVDCLVVSDPLPK
jgi:thiol-disulfide isomerase/thioredoxin